MECHDAHRLLDEGMAPGSADAQRVALGFHLAGCVACRAYRSRADNAQLLYALLEPPALAPRVVMPARPRRTHRALRIAGTALLVGGALALLPVVSSAPASAAPAPASTLRTYARRPTARTAIAAHQADKALLRSLLESSIVRAEARAARADMAAHQADKALLRSLLESSIVRAEARAARAVAIAVARAPLVAGQELAIPVSPMLAAQQTQSYTVQPGDSLWMIAVKYYGNGAFWTVIYNANTSVVGSNPSMIYPAQQLKIPTPAPATPPAANVAAAPAAQAPQPAPNQAIKIGSNYTVISGDTLSGIAFAAYSNASRWQDIYNVNKAAVGNNPNLIFPGTLLQIPQ